MNQNISKWTRQRAEWVCVCGGGWTPHPLCTPKKKHPHKHGSLRQCNIHTSSTHLDVASQRCIAAGGYTGGQTTGACMHCQHVYHRRQTAWCEKIVTRIANTFTGVIDGDTAAMAKDKAVNRTLQYQQTLVSFVCAKVIQPYTKLKRFYLV